MERTYIQWNIINWVTVVLMAVVGTTLLGVVVAYVKTSRGGNDNG